MKKISHMIIYIIDIQHTTWYTVKNKLKHNIIIYSTYKKSYVEMKNKLMFISITKWHKR